MPNTFGERLDVLADLVGEGDLVGRVIVDQVYAKYQELRLDLRHPGGGQAKYLETALFSTVEDNMRRLADAVLDGDLDAAMADAVETISGEVARLAPVDLGNLRGSAHPTVTSNGAVVYDRPPLVPRLSESELRALHPGGHPYG